jgi:hypothetical protein
MAAKMIQPFENWSHIQMIDSLDFNLLGFQMVPVFRSPLYPAWIDSSKIWLKNVLFSPRAQIEEIYVPVTTADLSDFSCMESAGVSDFSHEATDVMSGDIDLTTAVISGHVDVAPRPQKKRILAQAFQDDPTFMSNET